MIYLQLFWEFFKTGLFSVGGGLATIPFLQEISVKTGWYSLADLADMIAVAESTPGPIGVNTATYAGFITAGILGALCATLSLVLPSLIISLLVAKILQSFKDNRIVNNVFCGLRPASIGLIAAAGVEVLKLSVLTLDKFRETKLFLDIFNIKGLILAVLLFIAMRIPKLKKVPPPVFLLCGAVIGIIFNFAAV